MSEVPCGSTHVVQAAHPVVFQVQDGSALLDTSGKSLFR